MKRTIPDAPRRSRRSLTSWRATSVLLLGTLVVTGSSRSSRAQAPIDAGAAPREKLEGAALDSLLAETAKARQGVRTLRASFTQERKLTLLATTVKSSGELSLVAPDRLRWELAAPDDIVYMIGPEGLSYRTRSSKGTVPASGASIAKALADLRALLGGELRGLRERYVLTGSRGAADVKITGMAKDKSASVRGFVLTLDKSLALPLKARLLEGKSDAIEIVFSNPHVNVPIDPATMRP